MTRRADFNAEEWATVTQAPAMAAAQVISAERGGTLREAASMARVYNDARQRHDVELIDELVASPPALDPSATSPGADSSGVLREAVEIVNSHADPAETDAYRQFVRTVAQTVAGAHKEGGFLGIGGQEISDREQAVLDQIEVSLGGVP